MPSPVTETMDFPNALYKVMNKGKITRLEWGNPNLYVLLKDGFLMHRKADGSFDQLLVSDGDMMGEDWVVVSGHLLS